jgi:hypothetical protein
MGNKRNLQDTASKAEFLRPLSKILLDLVPAVRKSD